MTRELGNLFQKNARLLIAAHALSRAPAAAPLNGRQVAKLVKRIVRGAAVPPAVWGEPQRRQAERLPGPPPGRGKLRVRQREQRVARSQRRCSTQQGSARKTARLGEAWQVRDEHRVVVLPCLGRPRRQEPRRPIRGRNDEPQRRASGGARAAVHKVGRAQRQGLRRPEVAVEANHPGPGGVQAASAGVASKPDRAGGDGLPRCGKLRAAR